jgi:hypothetical protein
MKQQLVNFLSITLLVGCVNTLEHTIKNTNERFEQQYAPYRFIKQENKETHSKYQLEPAGQKKRDIVINKILLADIFYSIKKKCGFKKNDLMETRLVSRKHLKSYQVWIFKDALSEMDDKTSAISVVLISYPNNGGTDIGLAGNCHAKPMHLYFEQ